MEITKKIFGLLVAFLLNFSDIFAKPAAPTHSLQDLSDLNDSIFELECHISYTWTSMDWIRTKKGYPGLTDRPNCNLPTSLLYKRFAYHFKNVNKMQQHLKKIKNTLYPFYDATLPQSDFSKGVTNHTLKKALNHLAEDYIVTPLYFLHTMGYKGQGRIVYNTTKLTEGVQAYMKCARIPVTSSTTQFFRLVTFIEALDTAVKSLSGDVSFIQTRLSKHH